MADSQAFMDLGAGLKAVDDVLSFAKSGVGKPSDQERSLFVASVALSYAVWENYVEEVAIEATRFLSTHCAEGNVPDTVRDSIMKSKPDAWDLVVHPGWRDLWVQIVHARAKGNVAAQDFGINAANEKNVRSLFDRVGVEPFGGASKADLTKLDRLVEQRGQIVHTGKAPPKFYKANALDWRSFVEKLALKVDQSVSAGAAGLIGGSPW
jgi:hypothetical protein